MSKPMPLRTPELLVTSVAEEVLVYHPGSRDAICLNQTAALVFQNCDGVATRAQVAGQLAEGEAGVALLELTLSDLASQGLLQEEQPSPALSRRDFLQKWGKAAAALPLVVAVATPRPAQAMSADSLIGFPNDAGGDAPASDASIFIGGPVGADFVAGDIGSFGPDTGGALDSNMMDSPIGGGPDSNAGNDAGRTDAPGGGGGDSGGSIDFNGSDAPLFADTSGDANLDV